MTAGYSACFESAPRTGTGGLGRDAGVASANAANADLGKAGSGYALTVALAGLVPSLSRDEDPVRNARHPCSYSNARSGNADVRLVFEVGRPS